MLVIGKNPVLEILKTEPSEFNKIVLMKNIKPEPKIKEIAKIAMENKVNLMYLSKPDFLKYFNRKNKSEGISQGVLGFIRNFQYSSLKDIVDKCKKANYPVIVLLDEITDPHNLGAIIRSALCLGADGIVIPKNNSADINHTSLKASSGAAKLIPIAKETNLINSIRYLKQNGYTVIGADASTNNLVYEINYKIPVALVLGSEGKGLRAGIKGYCDKHIRIPIIPKIDSLNVSVSSGIILYEIFRQKNN